MDGWVSDAALAEKKDCASHPKVIPRSLRSAQGSAWRGLRDSLLWRHCFLHIARLPSRTHEAPKASAMSTSDPLRNPPSTNTGTRPRTAATTSGSASMAAGTPSSCRPPWLLTMTPAAPAATARWASSPVRMPLRRTGRVVKPAAFWTRRTAGQPPAGKLHAARAAARRFNH